MYINNNTGALGLNNVEARILVKGRPITTYAHNGKHFVEGRSGSNFEIEIINTNSFKIEAVISVDGLSVIDGKQAGPQSSGYLVEANSSIKIPGWKVTGDTAASFEFSGKDQSYSTGQTGSSVNNGVIGVMAFKDRNYCPVFQYTPTTTLFSTRGLIGSPVIGDRLSKGLDRGGATLLSASSASVNNDTASLASMAFGDSIDNMASTPTSSVNNIGTAFGEATDFKTTTVEFARGDMQAMFVIYYDDAVGLRARGIQVGRKSRTRHTAVEPQAFPSMGCPVPEGWDGRKRKRRD